MKIALLGAGGKMGQRCTNNLKDSSYDVFYIEIDPKGIDALKDKGIEATTVDHPAIAEADIVVLAVPDVAIRTVSAQAVPQMQKEALCVTLDPAAALAGHLPNRSDIAYFITHPTHPSVFNWEETEAAYRDYYGGIRAKQAIVCALMQGTDADYQKGENLAKVMYGPVTRSHRITVEQMGILEPAYSETLCSTCIAVVREALDEVTKRGVPYEAARDFILGHINIQLAVLFDELPISFSDAAIKALNRAKPLLFKEDWKQVFDEDNVREQIKAITS